MKCRSFFSFLTFSFLFLSQSAFSSAVHGIAWSDKATFAGTRNLSGQYNYNSSGSSLKVTYQSTGSYLVSFEGLGSYSLRGGHVQVTAYGSGKTYCKVSGWNRFRKMNVGVACYNSAGNKTDSQFTISVRNPEESEASYAYTYANEDDHDEYRAESKYTETPGTGVLIKRNSEGFYSVNFEGLSAYLFKGGHVQVTAAGSDNHACQVKSWHKVGTTLQTHVKCFKPNGLAADTKFFVHVTTQTFHGDDSMWAAYAWASNPGASNYTAHSHYSEPTTQIQRTETGTYKVTFDSITGFGKSNIHVSNYGDDFAHCKVNYWSYQNNKVTTKLFCFGQNGALKDSKLVVRLIYK